ncbi:sulfatase [Ningiella sp. W23]|uniref:sulfatase family protein n=1 Tax=Ningiella sp. W23 TaxID=3023715 RepID=UPI003757ABED
MNTLTKSLCVVGFIASASVLLGACSIEPKSVSSKDETVLANMNTDEQSKRPNIVFIMTDDHAYQAISAYGSNRNQTPNIDQLAAQGMRFDRAFVTNSICAPSRAVILTGKHSHLNGVRDNHHGGFDGSQNTFPKLLQANGYATAIVGKWHLESAPTGFDYWRTLPGQGDYYMPEFNTPDGKITKQGYVTDVITDMAIDWLDNLRDKDKPFMLMYQHKAPHREWMPAQEYLTAYKDAHIAEPDTLFDDYATRGSAAKEAEMRISDHMGFTNDTKVPPEQVKRMGLEDFAKWYERAYNNNLVRLTAEERANWDAVYGPIMEAFEQSNPRGDDLIRWKYQRYMQDYLASIDSVDKNVGRILDYLDDNQLSDNTMVVYTSDQGFYLGEHGWFDKRFMYEESLRTPLIVRWPNTVSPGSINNDLVQNLDFAQTFLQAAGVDAPNDMQGRSLIPLFEHDTPADWRTAIFYHYYEYPGIHAVKRHYGIRTERYKLIHFYHDVDEWELYDLQNDPQELNNLIGKPEYAQIVSELGSKLAALRSSYGDSPELAKELLALDKERRQARIDERRRLRNLQDNQQLEEIKDL